MPYTAEAIIFVILLFLSGFFSASEVALVSLSRLRLAHLLDKKVKGAETIKKLKADPERLLTTILVGNNVVNVGAAAIATDVAIRLFENNAVGIATGFVTFFVLVFGEIIPKYFAARFNIKMALFFAPIIWGLSILIFPIVKVFELLIHGLKKVMGVKSDKPLMTEEELKSIVKVSGEEGAIKKSEKDMIHRIFDLDNKSIASIMTRKHDMAIVNIKYKLKDVIGVHEKKQYSRMPVYEKSRDNIVGIINIRDMIDAIKKNKLNSPIKNIMRRSIFVPDTKKIDSLLRQFQNMKEHMAIVVDEHGSVIGLVTIEDVLEEIVGEIMDESDIEESYVVKIGNNIWNVNGKIELKEFGEKFRLHIKEKEVDTLNGFIIKHLGHMPKVGDSMVHENYKIVVDKVEKHKVVQARVVKKSI